MNGKGQRQQTIDYAKEQLKQEIPDLLAIYLFGSFGSEFQRKNSDLDLAILSSGKLDPIALWNLGQEIASTINRDVDIIDMQEASTVFRFQIVTTGQRIYCRDVTRCNFIENTYMSMYLRLNEERKDIIKDFKGTNNG